MTATELFMLITIMIQIRLNFCDDYSEWDPYFCPTPAVEASEITGTFTQILDHFNASNSDTWNQSYITSNQYYAEGGPIFIVLGPEVGSTFVDYVDNPNVILAKHHNACVVSLDHRYYYYNDYNRPMSNYSTANLKYLSTRQALADTVYFIDRMNRVRNFTNPRWIAFGYDYGGSLAAWLREKHPDSVIGAIISSAPVMAKLDFFEYLQGVERSLYDYSPNCTRNIHLGFQQIAEYMKSDEGLQIISDNFKDGIPQLCETMNDESRNLLQRMQDINLLVHQNIMDHYGMYMRYEIFKTDRTKYSYSQYLDAMRDESSDNEYRAWFYQQCTEFGLFLTTGPNGDTIFGNTVPLSFYVDQCAAIFGNEFTLKSIQNAVDETNRFYGERQHYNGTRVVFSNGNLDPWLPLCILNSTDSSIVSIMIDGSSHANEAYMVEDPYPPSVNASLQLIDAILGQWLSKALSSTTSTTTFTTTSTTSTTTSTTSTTISTTTSTTASTTTSTMSTTISTTMSTTISTTMSTTTITTSSPTTSLPVRKTTTTTSSSSSLFFKLHRHSLLLMVSIAVVMVYAL